MAINPPAQSSGQSMKDELKNWMMVVLTVVFVGLYTSALIGWLPPLKEASVLTRLEPIIFVIIGYYFGRLPAVQNERTLKTEIERKAGEAEAARKEKDVAIEAKAEQTARVGASEQRIRDAKAALATTLSGGSSPQVSAMLAGAPKVDGDMGVRHTAAAALNILSS